MSRLKQWRGLRLGQDYEIETGGAHYSSARVTGVDRRGVTLRYHGHDRRGRTVIKHDRISHADVCTARRLRG